MQARTPAFPSGAPRLRSQLFFVGGSDFVQSRFHWVDLWHRTVVGEIHQLIGARRINWPDRQTVAVGISLFGEVCIITAHRARSRLVFLCCLVTVPSLYSIKYKWQFGRV